ncbi:unnamed protein product [Bathycoccus prasinos]
MVWFVCDDCGDSIKKPALKKHFNNCSASRLSCVDCGAEFDRYAVQLHTKCVTEHEKYALGATKPGGKANVVSGASTKAAATREPAVAQAATAAAREEKEKIVGREYLATEAPWMCSCCNVECTGAETLKSHALAKTLRTQKEEENKANDEGKPKSMSPSAEEEKKKKKEEKRAKKKLVRLKSKENKKKILEEKLKVAKEKKARKDEKKRKREEEKTDEEKAKDAEKAKEREVKKAKRIELKAVKREKKLARKKAKQEAKKNGRGKTNVAALGTKEKGVKKKKVKAKYSGGKK